MTRDLPIVEATDLVGQRAVLQQGTRPAVLRGLFAGQILARWTTPVGSWRRLVPCR